MAVFEIKPKKRPRGKPFEKGNKHGNRFAPGQTGNPGGRPHCDISPKRILEELARLSFLDPRKMFNEDGTIIPITKLDDHTAAAIAGVEHEDIFEDVYENGRKVGREKVGVTTKVKLIQKTEALKLLGQFHKLFTDKLEITGDAEIVERLTAARKRVKSGSDT